MTYTICESVAAIVYHTRVLSESGMKPNGGADTPALCGANVAWDTRIPVTPANITCKTCKLRFVERIRAHGV